MKTKISINRLLTSLVLFAAVVAFASCVRKEDPSEARLAPSSINSEAALQAAVAGMYKQFTAANQWGFSWLRAYGGDDLTAHSAWNKQGYRNSDQMVVTPLTSNLNLTYTPYYLTINEANNIIDNQYNVGSSDNVKYMLGEAYFIRGFCYFHLTRSFGRIPMPLTSDVAANAKLPKSEILDIYKQIESDFLMAETLLPNKYPGVPAAIRPNRGSVKAYLAKLYMHWAGWPLKDNTKYAMAAARAKSVIDNASLYGFGLVKDIKTLWSIKNEYRFNPEMVFGLAHNNDISGVYSNRHAGRVGYPWAVVSGWSEVFPEYTYFKEFPAGPRRDATFRYDVVFQGKKYNWDELVDNQRGVNEVHPMFFKATGYTEEVSTINSANNINTYNMRYADLLLYYAEAVGRSGGNTPDAWEALNKVRRRAYGYDINVAGSPVDLTSGDLAELAYTERKWELGGEFKRWDDLARMERVAEANARRDPKEPAGPILGETSTKNYFMPFPQSEIDKAPHLAN